MATEKQIIANRQNSLNAGVRTEEGKGIAKMNAISHGLLSNEVVLPGENAAMLEKMRSQYVTDLQPQGEYETFLVERIITSAWRLKRLMNFEKRCAVITHLELGADEESSFVNGPDYRNDSWKNYSRYETSLEHQIYRARHELERYQRARSGEYVPAPGVLDINGDVPVAPEST
jgi:hypothetical protein